MFANHKRIISGIPILLSLCLVFGAGQSLAAEQPSQSQLTDGIHKLYFGDGILKSETTVQNGKIIGINLYYPNGNPKSILRHKEGILHGTQKEYYPDGTLMTLMFYKEGKLLVEENGALYAGVHKQYFEDGGIESETTYVAGIPNGPAKTYYPNGQVKITAVQKGNTIVSAELYDKDGILINAIPKKEEPKE